ncbi:hypothetical protein ACU4GD_28170 [Cupriavidus basilensis]
MADLDVSDRGELSLRMTDKLQRLNSPISEVKIGGTGENKDVLVCQPFGENHNIEPVLSNAALHE